MALCENFDVYRCSAVSIDVKSGVFKVGQRETKVFKGGAKIIAAYIDIANRGEKGASVKTMMEISGHANDTLSAYLSKLRKELSEFEIAPGVTADSLFLTEKIMGSLTFGEKTAGMEKRPYHFNIDLADLIESYGNHIPLCELQRTRLEPVRSLGRNSTPELFRAHVVAPPFIHS